MRMDAPHALDRTTEVSTPAVGFIRSAVTNAKASGMKTRPVGEFVVARTPPTGLAPHTVIAAPEAGIASTVARAPLTMIGGEIGSAAMSPVTSTVSAVIVNCCSRPLDWYDSRLIEFTPAMVKRSPFLSDVAPDAQPFVLRLEPVWFAPLMTGVEAVKVPVT